MDACALKRRTLNAYHACLTDFTFTSLVTSSLLPAILLGYWTFTRHFAFTTPTPKGRSFHIISRAPAPHKIFTTRSDEQVLKHKLNIPPEGPSQFQQRSFSAFSPIRHPDFWHLPFCGIYPHGPICLCFFLLLLYFLASLALLSFPLPTTHTTFGRRAIELLSEALQQPASTSDCAR